MSENRNLLLAVGLSVAILLVFNLFVDKPQQGMQAAELSQTAGSNPTHQTEKPLEAITPSLPTQKATQPAALIPMTSQVIDGQISTHNLAFQKFDLTTYKETVDQGSPAVNLCGPDLTQFDAAWQLPTEQNTLENQPVKAWEVVSDAKSLTPKTPLVFQFQRTDGLVEQRTYTIDENYLITITDTLINQSKDQVTATHAARLSRKKPQNHEGMMISHEGPIGVWKGKLQEFDYDKIEESSQTADNQGGWIGFSDKYWLASLMPDHNAQVSMSFSAKKGVFSAALTHKTHTIQPGERVSVTYYLFMGPKKLELLDNYEKNYQFQHFDLAVDFGWFYFLTKPLFLLLNWMNSLIKNMGIAIILLTILIKAALFPLANKSFQSMAKLKKLQPKLERIKTSYKHDPQRLQQEMMKLYKVEGVNPMGGCLPMLIQAPIFFCLYKVLYVTIEMRQAPFFGWIHDLSAPDPTTIFNLFGLLPFTPPSFLHVGLLPIVMGATMFLQQRLNPQPSDPAQAKVMMALPFIFTFLFASFPSGVVIYWAFSNVLGIVQQMLISRRA